jgi:hypothetical protein
MLGPERTSWSGAWIAAWGRNRLYKFSMPNITHVGGSHSIKYRTVMKLRINKKTKHQSIARR